MNDNGFVMNIDKLAFEKIIFNQQFFKGLSSM